MATRRTGKTSTTGSSKKPAATTKMAPGKAKRDTSKSASKFVYKSRSREQLKKRQDQRSSNFDSYVKEQFNLMQIKEGNYRIRLLPPTWDAPEHWGYEVFVHYQVGTDNNSYPCPSKMFGGPCPVCEEHELAKEEGDDEYAYSLKATKRVVVWAVNRDNEDEGPQLWSMPFTMDRDLALLCEDSRTGEIELIDHPEDGYDIEFTRQGSGKQTRYLGLAIGRHSTPVHDDPEIMDQWLEFILQNPIPDTLQHFDYEHIEKVFSGGGASSGGKADTEEAEDEDEDEEENEDNLPFDEAEEEPEEEEDDEPEEEEEEPEEEEEEPEEEEDDEPEEEEEPEPPRRRTPKKPSSAKESPAASKRASGRERLASRARGKK